jgi:hypothetical protein
MAPETLEKLQKERDELVCFHLNHSYFCFLLFSIFVSVNTAALSLTISNIIAPTDTITDDHLL